MIFIIVIIIHYQFLLIYYFFISKMAYVCELEFLYNYTLREEQKQLIVPLKLPFDGNVNELTVRLMKERDIPCYYEESLREELEGFIRTETSKWRDKVNDDVILDALEQKVLQ